MCANKGYNDIIYEIKEASNVFVQSFSERNSNHSKQIIQKILTLLNKHDDIFEDNQFPRRDILIKRMLHDIKGKITILFLSIELEDSVSIKQTIEDMTNMIDLYVALSESRIDLITLSAFTHKVSGFPRNFLDFFISGVSVLSNYTNSVSFTQLGVKLKCLKDFFEYSSNTMIESIKKHCEKNNISLHRKLENGFLFINSQKK